jgi:hypothetical protein
VAREGDTAHTPEVGSEADHAEQHQQHHQQHQQHHDIARQHHDAARRAAEQHHRAARNDGFAPGHPTRRGHGQQFGQADWDQPLGRHRVGSTTRRSGRSGGGAMIAGILVLILVLGGIAALVFGADRAYQQGEERAKAAYCEQAAELTGDTPPGC